MKKPNRIWTLLPLLMLLLPSCRSVQAADFTPVQMASAPNLKLMQHSGCQLSDQQSFKLQQGLSQIQSVFSRTLNHDDAGNPLTVQLFCDETDYRAYGSSTGSDTSSAATRS